MMNRNLAILLSVLLVNAIGALAATVAVNKTIVIETDIVISPAQGTGIAIGGILASSIVAIILCIVAVKRNELAVKALAKRTRDYYYSNKDL